MSSSLSLCLVLLSPAAPVPKKTDANPWVGKAVFPKTPAVRPMLVLPDGREESIDLRYRSYRVIREDGEKLFVAADGPAVWFRKASMLRADDAVTHFTALLKEAEADGAKPAALADLYAKRGWAERQRERLDVALTDHDKAVELDPNRVEWFLFRGQVRVAAGRLDDALADMTRAVDQQPGYAGGWIHRGWVRTLKKEYAEAETDITRGITVQPYSGAYLQRAVVREHLGRFADALADVDRAEQLAPEAASVWNHRAWVLSVAPDAKLRDGRRAVELATKAVEATAGREGTYLDTLAAAYAEAGRFDDAVTAQERAFTDPAFTRVEKAEALERLELYKQKKPYRLKAAK